MKTADDYRKQADKTKTHKLDKYVEDIIAKTAADGFYWVVFSDLTLENIQALKSLDFRVTESTLTGGIMVSW